MRGRQEDSTTRVDDTSLPQGAHMSRGSGISRRRICWQAVKSLKWHSRWAVDIRLLVLTILNGLLYWPWHLLRLAFDAGDHHPDLVFGLFLLTGWMWFELWKAVVRRFKR